MENSILDSIIWLTIAYAILITCFLVYILVNGKGIIAGIILIIICLMIYFLLIHLAIRVDEEIKKRRNGIK